MLLLMLATMFIVLCRASTNIIFSNDTTLALQTFKNPMLSQCASSITHLSVNRDECCSIYYKRFARIWYGGGYYLTTYLTTLRKWKCKEYNLECGNPVYDFTPFTKLIYQSFCDRRRLFNNCMGIVRDSLPANHSHENIVPAEQDDDLWRKLTASLNPREMTLDTLSNPCVQVALFDRPSGGVGRFHEMCEPYTLFGDITWVGYDIDTATERDISPWTTYSIRVKSSLIICFIVAVILCIAVIVANAIVIAVYTTTPKLRNSQAIYKLSVAASDLMSGLIVIPSTVVFGYLKFCVPREMGEIIQTSSNLTYLLQGVSVSSTYPTGYVDVIAFFTSLSLVVSLYTLLIASCDRLWAIFRPLGYNKFNSKKYAQIACCVVWVIGAFVAAIPFMISQLMYRLTPGLLVTNVGLAGNVLLAVGFGLPLILVCITNVLIFRSAHRHTKARKILAGVSANKDRNTDNMERRLSKILKLMVSVFVACVLPVAVTSLVAISLKGINFALPEQLDITAVKIYHSVAYCLCVLLLSNSLWNCLIYSVRGQEFRTAFRSLRVIRIAGSMTNSAISSIRRLSEVTLVYYRRKGSTNISDRKSSSVSTASMTLNSKNSATVALSKEFPKSKDLTNRTSVSKSAIDTHQYAGEEISVREFDSYAIDAGADRFHLSVMENIKET